MHLEILESSVNLATVFKMFQKAVNQVINSVCILGQSMSKHNRATEEHSVKFDLKSKVNLDT